MIIDIHNDADLCWLLEKLTKEGHQIAVFQFGSDVQCGWRHGKGRIKDIWGAALPSAQRAIQDATSRFVRALRDGSPAVYSHPSPEHRPDAKPVTRAMILE